MPASRSPQVTVPTISIIIPVHNMQEHLRGCLDSAVGQTMPDIEVICIDDHSSDASPDILREYAARDSRVRVITFPENRSVSQARKDGVLAAAGEYLMFLDADDDLELDACERLHAAMLADPVDILHFGSEVTNEMRLPEERIEWVRNFVKPYDGVLAGPEILEGCFREERLYNFSLWDKLYSAALCKRAFARIKDGRFPLGEDKYAYVVLSHFAQTYRGLPGEVLYHYHFGRGVTGHNLISLPQFEKRCMLALAADAIRDFLAEEDALERNAELYARIRDELLRDCVGNWNNHLAAENRAAGFDLMLDYWQAPEVVGMIARLNWTDQGHAARLLKESTRLTRAPRASSPRVIGTFYFTISNGGTQRILAALIKLWVELGYEVVLFTDVAASDAEYALPAGVKRVVLPSTAEVKPRDYADRAKLLEDALRTHEVDVMVYHAWVSKILLWDLLVCKVAGVSFITHCHNAFSQPARTMRTYFGDMPSVLHLSDTAVVLSEVDRVYWRNFIDDVVSVVNPLTFDLDEMEIAPLREKNVLWLGRISPEKRPHDALMIFAKVLEEEPIARLHMVGSCADQSYLESVSALASDLGISDSVIMHGFHKDVLPFYHDASVFLMTSEYEGFPTVLAESQSAGVPCVMYDLPYLTLTQARRGFVAVEMGDLNGAADAVVSLLANPERRLELGREARANIAGLASFDFSGTWRTVFEGLTRLPAAAPVDDATRIMWETLMGHYRIGVKPKNAELSRQKKELAGIRRAIKKQRRKQARIRASWSFRIGYAITAIPRAVRRWSDSRH